ncbi:MAG TPA: tetratricopeptide repeat protein [Terracidiphilus sp.]
MKPGSPLLAAAALCGAALFVIFAARPEPAAGFVRAGEPANAPVIIDYPSNGSIFPPEITPPTFIWRDGVRQANRWHIEIAFGDGSPGLRFVSAGEPPKVGAIDPRCVSPTNEPPKLSAEQASSHTWIPDQQAWAAIKKHSVSRPASISIAGFRAEEPSRMLSEGSVNIATSTDLVGAPIFYRDVPLMPSETVKGVISPLAANAVQLIQWRLRSIDRPESRIVLSGMHTCANCHSFSRDGKTMGMDMDGPRNDKGLYAVVPIQPQMTIRNEDMVNWNPTEEHQFAANRVGFMSQVSPDGKYVLSMVTPADKAAENNYYVANFKDYRFLQVFYPTRGTLAWFDRASGKPHSLPGADDPHYVQTDGVWSPDGKWVVFARAEALDPYPPEGRMALHANDKNERQIKYDLYRVAFNDGRGGRLQRIEGASENGMSNSFPKVSPDGRWIVFVQSRNGQLMRPDSQLYIVPFNGGKARRLNANLPTMNSWHSWSPNGRWLVFSSKSRGPYTRMYLTHVDGEGNDSPAVYIDNVAAANRAVNIPEFVNIPADGMLKIAAPAVDMYKQFDHAIELGEKGNDVAATAEWRALAGAHPEDARVQGNLGAELAKTGSYEEAVLHFRRALELNPQFNSIHGALASALVKADHLEEAMEQFQAALAIYPAAADLHNGYGNALVKNGQIAEAASEFARAAELNPRLVEAQNNLGIALARQGHPDEAIVHFQKAVAINPEYAEAHNNLGIAMLSNDVPNPAGAESEFTAAIRLKAHYADAECNLGNLYWQERRNKGAEELYRQAVASDPRFVKGYLSWATMLVEEGRLTEAEGVLAKAEAAVPGNSAIDGMRRQIKAQIGIGR